MMDEFDDTEQNNLLIVDSLNYAFKYKHKGTKGFAASMIRDMASFGKSYKATDIIILGDGGSYYRKNIYPEYKANRVYAEEDRQEFEEFLEEYNRALGLSKYPVLKFKGVEADDIAAYLVDTRHSLYDNVWILSTDKDLDLLLKPNVHRFSYINRKEVSLESFEEQYGYPPSFHISIKVLQGDSGDNINGIPGIGIKRAYQLIKQYGSAHNVYASLPLPGAQKFIQELNNSGDLILRNYDLMDLMDTYDLALGKDIINKIEEILHT